jgi:hypothetical protein
MGGGNRLRCSHRRETVVFVLNIRNGPSSTERGYEEWVAAIVSGVATVGRRWALVAQPEDDHVLPNVATKKACDSPISCASFSSRLDVDDQTRVAVQRSPAYRRENNTARRALSAPIPNQAPTSPPGQIQPPTMASPTRTPTTLINETTSG